MTLFFNLERLEALSKNSSELIVNLEQLHSNVPAKLRRHKLPQFRVNELKGKSFILNPVSLFNDKLTDPIYLSQYIKLAGRRDYAMYKLYNIKYLDLSFYPDIDINKIKHNPLLHIANNKIYFKYEES